MNELFLTAVSLSGISYALWRSAVLFIAIQRRIASPETGQKEDEHLREHIAISTFSALSCVLWAVRIITGGRVWSSDGISATLRAIVYSMPFISLGFVSDHLMKEEGGTLAYHWLTKLTSNHN